MRTIRDDLVLHKVAIGPLKTAPVYVIANVLDDINDVLDSLGPRSDIVIRESWHEIHQNFWIECTDNNGTIAFTVVKVPAGTKNRPWKWEICSFYRDHNTIVRDPIILAGDPENSFGYAECKLGASVLNIVSGKLRTIPTLKREQEKWQNLATSGLLTTIGLMQLLASKNVEVETIEPTSKELKAARRQKGKGARHKPSSYRVLKIGKPPPHVMQEESNGEGGKKRRHQVRGHFRTYRHERYKAETRGTYWIRPHWRGDEKLGIVNVPIILKKGTDV